MVIVTHHFGERHGALGRGTAIRAPKSDALHGFVGNGTDDSPISKILIKGYPRNGLPPCSFGRPQQTPTQNFFQ